MLNLEGLRPEPEYAPYKLPRATDKEVRYFLSQEIDRVAKRVSNKYRLDLAGSRSLFHINGSDKESQIRGDYGRLRVEHERMQRLGVETMLNYGLDPNHPLETRNYSDRITKIEWTLFPSQIMQDLAFERSCKYLQETDELVSLSWSVKDIGPEKWWDRVKRK